MRFGVPYLLGGMKNMDKAKISKSFSESLKNLLDSSLKKRKRMPMTPIIHNFRNGGPLVLQALTTKRRMTFWLDPWRMLASNLILSISRYMYGDLILRISSHLSFIHLTSFTKLWRNVRTNVSKNCQNFLGAPVA